MSEMAIAQLERQVALLQALDHARDSIGDDGDPFGMFRAIVRVLRDGLHADACAILLTPNATRQSAVVIATGLPEDMAVELTQEAMSFATPQPISHSIWEQTLGVQILIDREENVPGGLFLGRKNEPFTQEDVDLLTLAESQIDSAVVQARIIWKLAERNRELEVIYQIDRLRDDALDEDALYAQFVAILIKHFNATFCMLVVSDTETNHPVTRNLVDKFNLTSGQLEFIRQGMTQLQGTQTIPAPPDTDHLFLLGSPFIVAGFRLGEVIVGRKRPFNVNDNRLMTAITSQMDSAIAKSRMAQELVLRTRELEAIYRIDHIRDQEVDFDVMMQRVLGELCDAVNCETGYIVLLNAENDDELEVRATTRDAILTKPEYIDTIKKVSREALDIEDVVVINDEGASLHSIMATPLILNERVIGVFGAINSNKLYGFTPDDSRMLSAITSQVDTAIFERLERRRMRKVLSRSVDPKVLDALLQRADDSLLAGERVELSVLFGDLRGSTEWAERTDPEHLVQMLNMFLGMMTDIIFKHGGTLDKFVGDEVIALFGAPLEMEDHAYRATKCALEMQEVHQRLVDELAEQGLEIPPMGVGVASGEAIAGEFGPAIRTDFTAMGRVMNLGARLCSAAKGNQVIISENTQELVGNLCEADALEPITPKGINRKVTIFDLKKVH